MDSVSPRYQESRHIHTNPSLIPSPKSHSSNSSSTSSTNSNGLQPPPPPTPPPQHHQHQQQHQHQHQHQQPPKPITRSESANPYPTTFVQADTSSFKQVVQMLTGSTETAKHATTNTTTNNSAPDPPSKTHIPPIKSMPKRQQSGFKLYERRNSLKNFKINPLIPVFASNHSGFSPRKAEILSPSILDFPALALSPVTPLIPDPFGRSTYNNANGNANSNLNSEAEEKAIKEKGFYLHPSPSTTPREAEPRLLPLFPTTSPRVPGSSSSS